MEAGLRVLVVDDSRLMRVILTEAIRASDVPLGMLAEAEDGAEALRTLAGVRFDLVLTDLQMPRVDGFELIAELTRTDEHGAPRIVTLTAETGAELRARLAALPIHAHLTKPVTFDAVRDVVEGVWQLVNARASADGAC